MGKRNHHFYVCSHTHWDREWYGTFEDFRMRLVEMTDELLDFLEDEPDYRAFNFDGQTSVIRDYLEIRPERREDIRKFVSEGRLAIGPWYILPDEFLVSGESFVHNLKLGHKIAGEMGRVTKVGYLPDCFGHISQIPQILQGFGIDTIVFWRGFAPETDPAEWIVEGADGSRVLAHHLPPDGYCNLGFFAHQAPEEVRRMITGEDGSVRWTTQAKFLTLRHVAQQSIERDRSKVHLLMNGCDHMRIHKDLPEVLRRAGEEFEGWTFHHVRLDEYFEALKSERGEWPVARLPMRSTTRVAASPAYILAGVLSARIYLKQANHRCQTLLERWVGPFETIKWLETGRYEQSFVERAWELLLQNHPHDSICGCSADGVHRDMENRFERCEQIALQLLRRAQAAIAMRIDSSFAQPNDDVLVVFNPQPRRSSRLVEATLVTDAERVFVEDAAAPNGFSVFSFPGLTPAGEVAARIRGVRLFAADGEEIETSAEPISVEVRNEPHILPEAIAPIRTVLATRVRFWADDLPALGYRAYRFHFINRPTSKTGNLVAGPNILENEFLRVEIRPDGSVAVTDKASGVQVEPALFFEDGADCGDAYNFAKPPGDRVITSPGSPARIELVEDSPCAGSFEISQTMQIPECFDFVRRARSEKTVALTVTTRVTLGAKSPYVAFRTRIRNLARDHRFRAVFRPCGNLDGTSLAVFAEGPFDVVEWPIAPPHPSPEQWAENQPTTIPQGTFVDLTDGKHGTAVFNKGLPECEIVGGRDPRIYLTLFRSFGHISRPDQNDRARPAGPCMPTPEGQCLREMTFEYAYYPHSGRWDEANVLALAHEFATDLSSLCIKPSAGKLPVEKEFLRIEGDRNIALSTIERSQDGEALVVRLWNGTGRESRPRLVFDRPVKSVHKVRLDETVEEPLRPTRGTEVPLKIGPKKILTLRVVFEGQGDRNERH